jgi:hypothetical protein
MTLHPDTAEITWTTPTGTTVTTEPADHRPPQLPDDVHPEPPRPSEPPSDPDPPPF